MMCVYVDHTYTVCVMYVCVYVEYVEVTEQLSGVGSFLPLWVLSIKLRSSVQQKLSPTNTASPALSQGPSM